MSSKKLLYSGLTFGLCALLLTAVYPNLPRSQCSTQDDVARSIERSRDGIAHSCTESIRLVQIERQRQTENRLAQSRQQDQDQAAQTTVTGTPE
ncbi:MAG: hypothetical protein R3F53_08830 [Gammaproteobacteria bacterium]